VTEISAIRAALAAARSHLPVGTCEPPSTTHAENVPHTERGDCEWWVPVHVNFADRVAELCDRVEAAEAERDTEGKFAAVETLRSEAWRIQAERLRDIVQSFRWVENDDGWGHLWANAQRELAALDNLVHEGEES
jgi:hypothetical protein